jgi:hypothetical protein
MKQFLNLMLLTGMLMSCKKEAPNRAIQINITNIANTTLSLSVKNADGSSPQFAVANQNTNGNYTVTAHSGSQLTVVYYFATTGQQLGQGNIDFTYDSTSLLKINGGNGTQTIDVP